ncbi:MAG: hypothetical protein NTV01_14350 [Bacteroidia bacterium]|nr:hypothetical protein [Bacteroidia bacterium]
MAYYGITSDNLAKGSGADIIFLSTATLTVRLMDEKLNSTTPGGDAWMNEALQDMMLGTYTPESAAAYVQGKLNP